MGCSGDVPRVTGRGARKEGPSVVNKVGDNHFHKFLWEPDGLGRTCGRCFEGTFAGELFDFYPVSVPELISAPAVVSE